MSKFLETTFRRLAPALYRFAYSIVRHQQGAEEVVQDVFCKLASKKTSELTDAYIYTAVRNRAIDLQRKQRKDEERLSVVHCQLTSPDQASPFTEDLDQIRDAIGQLKLDYREIVVLRIFCGLTFSEIALIQKVSINTAASRYRYALEQLSRQLTRDGGTLAC